MSKLEGDWEAVERPGYFGRRRDEKLASFDALWGQGNWKIAWLVRKPDAELDIKDLPTAPYEVSDFADACIKYYERSYVEYLKGRTEDLDFICSFGECIDNDYSNIQSGRDYLKQESWATHIQDIAVRNALQRLGRKFEGPANKILVIRSKDSNGYKFGPGNVPFYDPSLIMKPSRAPAWCSLDTVEDFWQSNKWLMVRRRS